MSWVALLKAIIHRNIRVKTRKWAEGSVKATPAMAAAMRNSMANIHHLLLLARSMNGLHRGLTTHGR